MYTYTAGATGFDASMPTDVQEGGLDKWIERLKNPAIRKKVIAEMKTPSGNDLGKSLPGRRRRLISSARGSNRTPSNT
jgi:formylmethanofuran:tetrahydromethanopterin formyltransferase